MIDMVIAEDQAMLRDSLACAIDMQDDMHVVAAIADAADALSAVEKHNANLALLDVCTENDSSGIVAAAAIKQAHPDVRVVIMTGMPEITFVEQARAAGVDSFVYKNVGTAELIAVIRSTIEGYSTFPRPQSNALSGAAALTQTEIDILRLVCETKNAQGDRTGAVPVRRHREAPHLRDFGKNRLRQHPAPRRARGLQRTHHPRHGPHRRAI